MNNKITNSSKQKQEKKGGMQGRQKENSWKVRIFLKCIDLSKKIK